MGEKKMKRNQPGSGQSLDPSEQEDPSYGALLLDTMTLGHEVVFITTDTIQKIYSNLKEKALSL